MGEIIKKLEEAKTFEEQLEIVDEYFKTKSWYKFLKWEQFNVYDLMMCYDLMEDDDTTIWKEETPKEEREKGTKIILAIKNEIVAVE